MRRLIAVFSFAVAFGVASQASEFDWVVREFSRQSAAKPIHIPMFGVARFAVAVAHPAGATQLHLAVFENVDLKSEAFSHLIDTVVGSAWRPIVRVRSRAGESTNIYAQSSNPRDLHLLLATLDGEDATFIELRVKPETLLQFVDEHGRPH
ncbi:MAG: hypothetical protein JOY62_07500 [Acidobacteriaceae bacterium]|nr:hypothetical protein [Acidobacteriaceae bacterium]MBV9779803.1 hypothetical protein [Acidobacteriaceae bacterium]